MLNLFQYVGLRHLKVKPIRTLLTTLGIAFGISLFIAIEIINRSTSASFKENIEAVSGKATILVTAGETGFPEEKYETVRKVPGVKSAVPMILSRGYFAVKQEALPNGLTHPPMPDASESIAVLGVDFLQEHAVRTYTTADNQAITDPLVFLNQPDSIMVTAAFAKKNGLREDSTFLLATSRGVKKFTIRGLLSGEGPGKAYGGGIAIMDIDGARVTFGKEGKLDRIDIVTDPKASNAEINDVIQRLRKELGDAYKVEMPESQSESLQRMVQSYQIMMTFFSSLALLVGVFLVFNSVGISVSERRQEIGTLRALGASRKSILLLFLAEATVVGGVGALIGTGLGRLLASGMVEMVAKAMTAQFFTRVDVARLLFGPGEVLRAVVLGAGASFLAAAWPAYRATQIEPLEAMKRRQGEDGIGKYQFIKLTSSVGFLMLVFVTLSSVLQLGNNLVFLANINQVFSILGSALLGPGIVTLLIRLSRPIALPLGGTITRLAQDNLIRNPQRTGTNVMSLMVGLILVVLVASVSVSFKKSIMNWVGRVFKADLVASSAGNVLYNQTQPLHESVGLEISQVPGLRHGPRFAAYGSRYVHVQYEDHQIMLKASDEPDPAFRYIDLDVQDRPREEAQDEFYHSVDPVILVSENFSLRFKKKRGDSIQLTTPTGQISFKVIGVLIDYASDVGVIHVNRDFYKRIWRDPLVNSFHLQLNDIRELEQVRSEIDRRFGRSKNLAVISDDEIRKQMYQTIEQSFGTTRAIEWVALLVGLMGLFNTLLVSVMERVGEIGMLRAIGMSRGQVFRMILQEALFQGGLGAITAVVLGTWLAFIWVTYSLSSVLGWVVTFYFPWGSIGSTLFAGLSVAVIAGILPARRAAYLDITEALDYE